jgi:hypothetical protein
MATDEQIATAFNAGYTMQKIDPVMVEKLLATDNKDNEIVQAMREGAKQSQREKIVQQQQAIKERKKNKNYKR